MIGQHFHGHAFGQCKSNKTRHLLHLHKLSHLFPPVVGFGFFNFACFEFFYVCQLFGCAEQAVAHALCCGYDIGVGFLKNFDFYTFYTIDPRDDLPLLVRAINLPHIFYPDFNVVAVAYHQIGNFVNGAKFIQRTHEVLRLSVQQTSASQVDIFLLQPPVYGVDIESHQCQLPFADFNPNFFFESAFYTRRRYAFERFQFLLDFFFGDMAQYIHIFGAVNPNAHYRVLRGVVAQYQWAIDPARQVEAVEVFAHCLHGIIHIGVPAKFQNDIGHAGSGDRCNAYEIAHNPQALFNGP